VVDGERLLEDLDAEQRVAVTHGEGPLLVVAGAGSGKTRVLTYRVAWLLGTAAARPHEILAVTFTNKAAREMVERVQTLLGGRLAGGFVGTFHRFALQLLRGHAREAGLPERFAVADEDEQRRLLDRVLKALGVASGTLKPNQVRARISRAKNGLQDPEALAGGGRAGDDALIADAYAAYEEGLRAAGAIDFDDMLLLAYRLLEQHEALRKGLAQRFRWVLVDEYQDTNTAQARLLRLLCPRRPNLTAVGDEDQSIYRWRGADVENILSFEQSYPGAKVVTLGRNYRSKEPILAAAAAVIARNARRRSKRLSSEAGPGEPVVAFQAADEEDEARFVVEEVARLEGQVPLGRVAILFRINAQSRPFEAFLVRRAIPYQVRGGTRFWERTEVRDALAYLRLLVFPDDELAFRRAVNVPARGIGQVTMDRLEGAAARWQVSLPEAARRAPDGLTARAGIALQGLFTLLDELRALAGTAATEELVQAVLERSGLAAQYHAEDDEDRARLANLDQLVAAAAEAGGRGLDLAGFLDEVALLTDSDAATAAEAVQLSTLHAAKGLEFEVVFLVGMEEGLLPLHRGGEPEDVEEERRLAYVGMTRARRRLVLTMARARRLHGQLLPGRPSPFILDVPRELIDDRTVGAGRDPFRAHLPGPSAARGDGSMRGLGRPPGGGDVGPAAAPSRSARRGSRGHPDGWRPGLKVRHPSFGHGVILQVQGSGAQTRLVVYFDRAGRKTLLPSIARLEPL
jgi:DNA helicase-2/ATP-dependent DNA helicase PcrA